VAQRWFLERDDQNLADSRVLSFLILQGVACVWDTVRPAVTCNIHECYGIIFRGLLSIHHRVSYMRTVRHTCYDLEAIRWLHQALFHKRHRRHAQLRLPLVHREATRAYSKVNWTLSYTLLPNYRILNWIFCTFIRNSLKKMHFF